MSTPRVNYSAPIARSLVAAGAFAAEPFVLVDVGASGGIGAEWRRFEPHLMAFAFDPLVSECERLNAAEKNPNVRYFDRFVGFEGYASIYPPALEQDLVQGWSNQPFARTSAARFQDSQAQSFTQRVFNSGAEVKHTEQRTSLDAFFAAQPGVSVDFIKVDTDGHDYEVLCGARRMLEEHKVLGLIVEMQFHGVTHPHANLFANIDGLLRGMGFSLFDLETYRYTRAALPGHFSHSIAAQTDEGQILWGDALYLRDLGAPGYEARWKPLAATKLLKLICLLEMFGLADCAAELVVMKRAALASVLDVDGVLDQLAAQIHPGLPSFAEVNRRFDAAPEGFYPRPSRARLLPPRLRRLLKGWWEKYLR